MFICSCFILRKPERSCYRSELVAATVEKILLLKQYDATTTPPQVVKAATMMMSFIFVQVTYICISLHEAVTEASLLLLLLRRYYC